MKNLLPDTIAVRAMILLVVGLAFTHLVSNLFYSTDRESALLTAGGGHAIQWVAATGAFADKVTQEEWQTIVKTANSDNRFVTLTQTPVVRNISTTDWRDLTLQRELRRQVPRDRIGDYRIAYAQHMSNSPEISYWQEYFDQSRQELPSELVLVSLKLNNGMWLNVAAPIQAPPRFFSTRLWLSMSVMLIAVVMISYVIVGRMTAPLKQLSQAAEKLGTDVHAPAIPETGPEEVRRTAHAFNVMQDRIRSFVEDRTQMLGAIAHDLGTPITRLRLRAEFVEDRQLRQKMLRDLDDMQQMVASTLAFIREEASSEPREIVDLASLLARVCDDIHDTGVDVELNQAPRGVLFECGPIGLRRALANLVENAAKYGKRAMVSLVPGDETVRIIIDDEGPGIPDSRQNDVFQPFRRLDASRNQDIAGTGLGLAISRTIVRAHGGDIRICNRTEGGLRAEICLPVSRQAKSTRQTSRSVSGAGDVCNFSANDNQKPEYAVAGIYSGAPVARGEGGVVIPFVAGSNVSPGQWDDRSGLSRDAMMAVSAVSGPDNGRADVTGGSVFNDPSAARRFSVFSLAGALVAAARALIMDNDFYKKAGRKTGR